MNFKPSQVDRFQLSSVSGHEMNMPLDLGAFGVSRYALDFFLFKKAVKEGVDIRQNYRIDKVNYLDNYFEMISSKGQITHTCLVIGSFGKRSKLDKYLKPDIYPEKISLCRCEVPCKDRPPCGFDCFAQF